jgi:sigma-B regulation protein RsbU (phosphoserine phosphatase)
MDLTPGNLLVVGASPSGRQALLAALAEQGHTATALDSGAVALEALRAQPFDLVLLGFHTADIGAHELLQQLKADPKLRELPVIVLVSGDKLDDLEPFLVAGADDYLREPFSPLLLRTRVRVSLEKKQHLDSDREQKQLAKLERDIQIGRKIQGDFLPETLPQLPGWEIASRFYPARNVSGDFYDAFPLSHNRVGLVIADVCDKGVGAALFMALFRSLIRAFGQQHHALSWLDALEDGPPSGGRQKGVRRGLPSLGTSALKNAIEQTNNYIATNHYRTSMFATVFFGILDCTSGALMYINGGHELPAIVGTDGVRERLRTTGPAVGMIPDAEYEIEQAQLNEGEILYSFTDGVPDARNPAGKLFTEQRLLSLLVEPAPTAVSLIDRVDTNVRGYIAEADQFDDITMLAVRRIPKAAA